ncbi:MAG: quinoprotein dehydrogenase-associated putative ABC transporter substrate-binding protein [Alphaproteobacteria bacterium]|nr:quinoprotein dehydrogenase-associated putative ABC transporter substrate-binding protein [Alphaproteobacteria bacterium]
MAVLLILEGGNAHSRTYIEAVDRERFRVCADGNLMPYSNKEEEGFDNKIAALFAEKLGRPVVYEWYPQVSPKFVRDTLDLKKCDVVMGVPAGVKSMLNTNPYYRTGYMMVVPKDSGITARSLDDPEMANLKIGVVAGSQPSRLIVEYGLADKSISYALRFDTRKKSIGRLMIQDLKEGLTDVALMFGPKAAYHASAEGLDVELIPIKSLDRHENRMDFLMTMGVRIGEQNWKRTLNELIKENQDEITAILEEYGVPLMKIKRGRRKSSETSQK